MYVRMQRNGNPLPLLVGIQTGTAILIFWIRPNNRISLSCDTVPKVWRSQSTGTWGHPHKEAWKIVVKLLTEWAWGNSKFCGRQDCLWPEKSNCQKGSLVVFILLGKSVKFVAKSVVDSSLFFEKHWENSLYYFPFPSFFLLFITSNLCTVYFSCFVSNLGRNA